MKLITIIQLALFALVLTVLINSNPTVQAMIRGRACVPTSSIHNGRLAGITCRRYPTIQLSAPNRHNAYNNALVDRHYRKLIRPYRPIEQEPIHLVDRFSDPVISTTTPKTQTLAPVDDKQTGATIMSDSEVTGSVDITTNSPAASTLSKSESVSESITTTTMPSSSTTEQTQPESETHFSTSEPRSVSSTPAPVETIATTATVNSSSIEPPRFEPTSDTIVENMATTVTNNLSTIEPNRLGPMMSTTVEITATTATDGPTTIKPIDSEPTVEIDSRSINTYESPQPTTELAITELTTTELDTTPRVATTPESTIPTEATTQVVPESPAPEALVSNNLSTYEPISDAISSNSSTFYEENMEPTK